MVTEADALHGMGNLFETYSDCSIGRGLTGANCHRLAEP